MITPVFQTGRFRMLRPKDQQVNEHPVQLNSIVKFGPTHLMSYVRSSTDNAGVCRTTNQYPEVHATWDSGYILVFSTDPSVVCTELRVQI